MQGCVAIQRSIFERYFYISLGFRFRHLTGVDISGEMIHFAKMHHEPYDDRLDFKQVDLMNLIQPAQVFPRRFDKIFSFYCLHWIKDHRYRAQTILFRLDNVSSIQLLAGNLWTSCTN